MDAEIVDLAVIGRGDCSSHDEFTTTNSANVNNCFPARRLRSLINGQIRHQFINMKSLQNNQFRHLESGVWNIHTNTDLSNQTLHLL